MKAPLLVTCAIIEKEGRFLLTQRPSEKTNGDRWEFPGGKVEHGEDPKDSLEREIMEELGIRVTADKLLGYSSHLYEGMHVVLLAFHCSFISGEIEKKDIQEFTWATPSEMGAYDITEADLPFLPLL
jgi:8-oxo-dGTP diphosphatase